MKDFLTKKELEKRLDDADEKVTMVRIAKGDNIKLLSTSYTDITPHTFNGKVVGYHVSIKTNVLSLDGDDDVDPIEDTVFVASEIPVEILECQIKDYSNAIDAQNLAKKASLIGIEEETLAHFPVDVDAYLLSKRAFMTALLDEIESASGTLTKEEVLERVHNAAPHDYYSRAAMMEGKMNIIRLFYVGAVLPFDNGFDVATRYVRSTDDGEDKRMDDVVYISSENPVESLEKQVQECNDAAAQSSADKAVYHLLKVDLISDLIKEFEPAD